MNPIRARLIVVALLSAIAPLAAHAHRAWMLPSSTMTAGKEPVVTVDACVTEELFDLSGNPQKLEAVSVTAPDGSAVAIEGSVQGRHRSSFDFRPVQKGTYRIANVSESLFASYKQGGEIKRWRGTADSFATEVPAGAQDLQVTRMQSRVETFVSHEQSGGQAMQALQGAGLELVPLSAPTDLSVDDVSSFRLMLDGRPAANVLVTVLRGGNRYRYKLGEITLKTDADGRFSVKWPEGGQYWLSATIAPPRGEQQPSSLAQPLRRLSYSATFEVLPR